MLKNNNYVGLYDEVKWSSCKQNTHSLNIAHHPILSISMSKCWKLRWKNEMIECIVLKNFYICFYAS